jgi:hypothetical protein
MAKSLLDQLREQLEDIEYAWLFFFGMIFLLGVLAGLTLLGVYFYTRH